METIFSKRMVLTPKDTKTNVPLCFFAEHDLQRMEIRFRYFPKALADVELAHRYIDEGMAKYAPEPYRKGYKSWTEYLPIVNLLTVSLDSPEGYLGCAHRQNPEQVHVLTETKSDYGFIPARLPKGEWTLTVNVHALVSESCTFELQILGEEKEIC